MHVLDVTATMRRNDHTERAHNIESQSESASPASDVVDDWPGSGDPKSNGNDCGFPRAEVPLDDRCGDIGRRGTFDPE